MTWFRVDDKLHDHRKARKAGKAAMGVWTLAGSWCMASETDGFVPTDVLARWGTPADAKRLVDVGFWVPAKHQGETGWRFHDWEKFQPSAATMAGWRAAESDAGQRGNHKRWHSDRGVTDPNCSYCYRVPDQVPDEGPDAPPESGANRPPDRVGVALYPDPYPTTTPNGVVGASDERADVIRICEHLADAVAENGSKRPAITKSWKDEARRMLDIDKRTEAEVIKAIDWCQRGESDKARFWRPNVMSMPKLRQKFDQMRLQAANENRPAAESNALGWLRLGEDLDNVSPFRQIGGDR